MKTRILFTRFVSIILMSVVLMPALRAEIHQPLVRIPLVNTPPVIDGALGDASWERSAELTGFENWTLNEYVKDPVRILLCYDDKNLYVAFRNSDPASTDLNNSVKPKRPWDTFLWGGDYVMVVVANKDISVQLIADPKGTMTDYKNDDINWNGKWQYAASINKDDWTAEYKIPFGEFGLESPGLNKELKISLTRSFPKGESSHFSGNFTLGSQANSSYQYGKWPVPVPGKNSLPLVAHNYGTEKLELTCELELIPLNQEPEFINQAGQGASSDLQLKYSKELLNFKKNYTIPAGGTLTEKVPYELPSEGSYYATATIKSKDGKILRRSEDFWFTLEPNNRNIKLIKERLGEGLASMKRISNPVVDGLVSEGNKIEQGIVQLEKSSGSAWNSQKWDEFSDRVKIADREVSQFLQKVKWTALNNWSHVDDFGIALAHSVIKLRRDALFPLPVNDQIDLSLAGNEYESFQLAILPFGRDLDQLTVEVSDLKDGHGNTISKSNIELSLVDYNNIDWQPDYVIAYKGWHPDPLIPLKAPVKIKGTEICRPVWITIYTPHGTPGGNYTGTIQVRASGSRVVANIKCRVWDFELPTESHLKTHSWDEISTMADFYNVKELPIEWYLRFCGLLLKNRFNPGFAGLNYVSQMPDKAGNYDFSRVEKVLTYCIDRGLNRFSIIQMKKGILTPAEADIAYKFTAAYARFLREKGWMDKALVELWDEPTDLEWPGIKERAEQLKKIDPGLRLQLFAEGGPYSFFDKSTDKYGLNNLVDIWAPLNPVESPEAQAKGGEIWAYFCTLTRESAPNFFIECPAIYQRSIAWYCWMYGLDGFEHWSTTYYWRNALLGKPMNEKWPNVPWDSRTYHYFDGEGQLVYPGADGVPYSSIRLENFRDGMDDYEYLYKLKELLSAYDKDSTNAELKPLRQLLRAEDYLIYKYPKDIRPTLENTLRYPDQPEKILEARVKIAEAIEKLEGIKGK